MGLFKRKKKLPVLWRYNDEFQDVYCEIKEKTLVTQDRCFMLYQWARHCASLKGDMAEVGVYRGGTARMLAKVCAHKRLHLFDTFEGMPATNASIDYHQEGEFADTSLAGVQSFLQGCGNVTFHQGRFPATASDLSTQGFCFVHVDTDIYQSVKDCLEYYYPRMVAGGVIMFDDFQWKDCPGVEKALDEFLAGRDDRPVITALYQCAIIKN